MHLINLYYKKSALNLLSEKNMISVKEIFPILFITVIVSIFNQYLYLYLIRNLDFSYLIPLNQLFIILFSAFIGVYLLNEDLNRYNLVGLIFGIISTLRTSVFLCKGFFFFEWGINWIIT